MNGYLAGDDRPTAGGKAGPAGEPAAAELVDRGDLDDLVRLVDRLCRAEDWAGLVDLRDRCRQALERGRQLWPVASHAEYRLALEAPGRRAAGVLVPGAGRFALGPLPEVAASTHRWADLAPHAPATPEAALAAHERVVRGEDLTGERGIDPTVLELPLRLQSWEPQYPVAHYEAHEAQFPEAAPHRLEPVALPPPGESLPDPDAVQALVELAATWKRESNGETEAVAVRGDALAAVACLTPPTGEIRVAPVDAGHALAAMAWAAASGGAHGRRAGMAAGRFAAWWAVAALDGTLDRWPFDPDDLGEAAGRLRWYRWEAGAPAVGWSLNLAAEDRLRGRAWALRATDRADTPDSLPPSPRR